VNGKLIIAAAGLRRQAPEAFEEFLDAFRAFTETQRDDCIRAPSEHLSVAQGRAQNCTQILRLFDTCLLEAAKHEK